MAKKRILTFLLVILLLSIFSIVYPHLTGQVSKQIEYPLESATLLRVLDGDTIEIDSGPHVRLLGINTPEKKMPFSNESANFLKQFVGKKITLERDKEDTDKYKRKLRYIYYENRFLNLEILEQGLANSYYTVGLKYEKEVLNAEKQAKDLEIGIWTKSSEICSDCIKLKELNAKEEYFIIFNQCNYNCVLDKWFVKDAGRNTFYLSNLSSGQEKTYESPDNKEIWNNEGDRFFLFDNKGFLATFYSYP